MRCDRLGRLWARPLQAALSLGLAGLAGLLGVTSITVQAQPHTETTLALTIVDGKLPAELRLITVHKGERLRWRVSSNTAGELHLHAYRLSAHVQPGQSTELVFTAFASGRFRLEWHAANASGAAAGAHHAPPLALLEVRPN